MILPTIHLPPSNAHSFHAGDNWTFYSFQPAIDGRCDPTWCPWSQTCANNTDVVANYCSGIDINGNPVLNTDVNCVQWGS